MLLKGRLSTASVGTSTPLLEIFHSLRVLVLPAADTQLPLTAVSWIGLHLGFHVKHPRKIQYEGGKAAGTNLQKGPRVLGMPPGLCFLTWVSW